MSQKLVQRKILAAAKEEGAAVRNRTEYSQNGQKLIRLSLTLDY